MTTRAKYRITVDIDSSSALLPNVATTVQAIFDRYEPHPDDVQIRGRIVGIAELTLTPSERTQRNVLEALDPE